MIRSLADLFSESSDLSDFDRAVRALEGDFPFDSAAMVALGDAYFSRHPERSADRDLEAVRLGYEAVRIAAVEKIVRGLAPEAREFFRTCFRDPSLTAGLAGARLAASPPAGLLGEAAAVSAALETVRASVEEIPKGRVKERYIGGISLLYNVLYLIRTLAGRGSAAD
jgi:hypothetical protein